MLNKGPNLWSQEVIAATVARSIPAIPASIKAVRDIALL